MDPIRFHLAFPVANIPQTKTFYVEGLGCEVGRETSVSVILNLQGHQLVAHVSDHSLEPQRGVYPRHFGLIFPNLDAWQALCERAQTHQLKFYQKPKSRFRGTPLEHNTFFLEDPFYNLLEFKFYQHPTAIFGEQGWNQVGDQVD